MGELGDPAMIRKAQLAKGHPPSQYASMYADERGMTKKQKFLVTPEMAESHTPPSSQAIANDQPPSPLDYFEEAMKSAHASLHSLSSPRNEDWLGHDAYFYGHYREWRRYCLVDLGIVNVDIQHSCYLNGCSRKGLLVRVPGSYDAWGETTLDEFRRLQRSSSLESVRVVIDDSLAASVFQRILTHIVPKLAFYGCTASGRHHVCNSTHHECPFIERPDSNKPLERDVFICASSGIETSCEFAPDSFQNEVDKKRERDSFWSEIYRSGDLVEQTTGDSALPVKFRSYRSPLEPHPVIKRKDFSIDPLVLQQQLQHKASSLVASAQVESIARPRLLHVNYESLPWQNMSTDLFFGRALALSSQQHIRPDELSPHWIGRTQWTYEKSRDFLKTGLELDDYATTHLLQWDATLADALCDYARDKPALFVSFVSRDSNDAIVKKQKSANDVGFSLPLPLPRTAKRKQGNRGGGRNVATRSDTGTMQEMARDLTSEIWRSPLRNMPTHVYCQRLLPEVFLRMAKLYTETNADKLRPWCVFYRQHLDSPVVLREIDACARHTLAAVLASGRVATLQGNDRVMGTGNTNSFAHQRIRDQGIMAAVLECGMEWYLFAKYNQAYRLATKSSLIRLLEGIVLHWILPGLQDEDKLDEFMLHPVLRPS